MSLVKLAATEQNQQRPGLGRKLLTAGLLGAATVGGLYAAGRGLGAKGFTNTVKAGANRLWKTTTTGFKSGFEAAKNTWKAPGQ